MLEWTGERFLPWIKESTIAYEHLHRYAYAATLVKEKRVLDLACGEGYGSKMLAGAAASVVGIDIDEATVAHANSKYAGGNLQYVHGSITSVPVHDDHSFDVIICFEAIEHIDDQEALLREAKRLLKADGLFVVSTPNKTVYHDESSEENPYHVKELYFEEFETLLSRHFKNVRFLGQRIHPGSSIWPIGADAASRFHGFALDRGESSAFQFITDDKRVPLYFIAVASDSTAALPVGPSVLVDQSDGLIKEKDEEIRTTKEAVDSANEALLWREQQLKDRDQQIQDREAAISSLEEAVTWREGQIRDREATIGSLTEGLEWTRGRAAELEKTIESNEQALAWREKQVDELQFAKTALEEQNTALLNDLHATQRQLNHATGQLDAIYASSGWKFILRVRHIRDSVFPPGSSRRKLLEKLMGLVRSRA